MRKRESYSVAESDSQYLIVGFLKFFIYAIPLFFGPAALLTNFRSAFEMFIVPPVLIGFIIGQKATGRRKRIKWFSRREYMFDYYFDVVVAMAICSALPTIILILVLHKMKAG